MKRHALGLRYERAAKDNNQAGMVK